MREVHRACLGALLGVVATALILARTGWLGALYAPWMIGLGVLFVEFVGAPNLADRVLKSWSASTIAFLLTAPCGLILLIASLWVARP